jgi:hypothetical protein
VEPTASPIAGAPVVGTPVAGAEPTPSPAVAIEGPNVPAARPPVPSGRFSGDPVATGLVAVESRLARGELELAVVELLELSVRFPQEPRVGVRLARVLHQRALQRYGQGALAAAIADWERVVELDGDNALARSLLAAARAEATAAPTR